jgi:hypothetical protein
LQVFCHINLQYSFSGTGKNVFPKKAKKNIQAKKQKDKVFFAKKRMNQKRISAFRIKTQKMAKKRKKCNRVVKVHSHK